MGTINAIDLGEGPVTCESISLDCKDQKQAEKSAARVVLELYKEIFDDALAAHEVKKKAEGHKGKGKGGKGKSFGKGGFGGGVQSKGYSSNFSPLGSQFGAQ